MHAKSVATLAERSQKLIGVAADRNILFAPRIPFRMALFPRGYLGRAFGMRGELPMLDGVILLGLCGRGLAAVRRDRHPLPRRISRDRKWGFILLTAYTGVFGAFLYVLGCPEPLPGLHEQLHGRALAANTGIDDALRRGRRFRHSRRRGAVRCPRHYGAAEEVLEYVLGFAFGWTIFQALVPARHGRRFLSAAH